MTADGVERAYEMVIPDSYDGRTPYPLVLGLHALTMSYRFVPDMTGFNDTGDAYDFIGVAPSGRLNGTTPFWNAAPAPDNYDVAFISELLDTLEASLCIDTAQVFSTGMSNGAQMSTLLACRLSTRITAIAAIAGVEFLAPCDGSPEPIIAFHGTADPILPYTGGGLNATNIASSEYYHGNLPPGLPAPLGVDESMRRWAEHNGCDATFVEQPVSDEVRLRTWPRCAAATELYIVDGGGHAWPGKPVPAFEAQFGHGTTDIDASALMFAFFFDAQPATR
jgi:polyhydroxybutyrate depolymerase